MILQKLSTPVVLACLIMVSEYPAVYAQQPVAQPAQQSLNNDAIVKLAKAGLSDDLIVNTVNTSPGAYDVSPDGLIALKSAGISDRVVSAIVAKSSAAAQSAPAPAPAPVAPLAPIPAAGPAKFLLAEGSDVFLAFDEELSSKTSSEGDPVALVVTDDVKVGDVVVIKAGAKAVGEITNAEKSEMMGKGGELNMRLDYVKARNVKVHLRGTKGAGGKDSASIGLMLFCFACAVFHHGKEIKIQKGTALHAYVSDDISLPAAE
jgi:hypothetical protein